MKDHLPELLRVVARLRDPKLEIIDEDYDKDSKENISKLYYGIKSGKFANDAAAAAEIYGAPATDTRYSTLKSRLKRKLLNSLFLLDLGKRGYSKYAQTLYRTNKRLFVFKTLLTLGARNLAVQIGEAELSICAAYHLTAHRIELLRELLFHASMIGNDSKFAEYASMLQAANADLTAECRSEELAYGLQIHFAKKAGIGPEVAEVANKFAEELRTLRASCSSSAFVTNYSRVQVWTQLSQQNYRAAIELCEEFKEYLNAHPLVAFPSRYGEFALFRLAACRAISDYEGGNAAAIDCGKSFLPSSNNWFVFNEELFLLSMNTLHFDAASKIYHEVTTNPRFESQNKNSKERWFIFGLYLRYIELVRNRQSIRESGVESGKLRIKTFLRTVPVYTSDKLGFNVAILVLQIVMLLEIEDFDSIITRMEALRTYRSRYLPANQNRQSSIFFKLLQIMEKNSFSFKLVSVKSAKYVEQLAAANTASDLSDGVQIVPFTWLWDQILSKLKEVEQKVRA